MPAPTLHRRIVALLIPVLAGLLVASVTVLRIPSAQAATPLTVAQAIASQSGTGTVVGYVVGEPTATDTVRFGSFTGDTALAIADSKTETSTSRMLYVQITSAYRSAFGLATNPSNIGRPLTVTGTLTAYFSHAGLKSPTAMTFGAASPTATPTAIPTASSSTGAYYAAAAGKSGSSLKSALHTIISTGATTISYDAVWNALKVTDQDPANSANVILLYSGVSRSKTLNGGATGNWNREHVWPQSHGDFGTSSGPGTDLHHLRPEDVTINALRGNKDFDAGGTAVSGASGNYTDADSWEPRAAIKGDVARMVFYMAVRYEGDDSWANLEVNNSTANGSNPYLGKLSTLLAWHTQDPPTAAEKARNQLIYSTYQHNRNPFIDHPEWAASIFG